MVAGVQDGGNGTWICWPPPPLAPVLLVVAVGRRSGAVDRHGWSHQRGRGATAALEQRFAHRTWGVHHRTVTSCDGNLGTCEAIHPRFPHCVVDHVLGGKGSKLQRQKPRTSPCCEPWWALPVGFNRHRHCSSVARRHVARDPPPRHSTTGSSCRKLLWCGLSRRLCRLLLESTGGTQSVLGELSATTTPPQHMAKPLWKCRSRPDQWICSNHDRNQP